MTSKTRVRNVHKDDFTGKMVQIDESMREIASLDELYNELVSSKPGTPAELEVKKDEARFARERMLKLSMHVKNLIHKLESHEHLK